LTLRRRRLAHCLAMRAMRAPSRHQRSILADEALRAVVLSYLAEHPEAMDSIEGIAEWWITRQQIRVDVERLSHVLEGLTESGVLEIVGLGAQRLYRLRRDFAWETADGAPARREGSS
jgi:hypothetical protein